MTLATRSIAAVLSILLVAMTLAALMPQRAHAQNTAVGSNSGNTAIGSNSGDTGLTNPLAGAGISDIPTLLQVLLKFLMTIGGIVIVVMIVLVGFKFVMAQGNSERLQEARTMLLWTVIGALIILGAEAISIGIQATVTQLAS